MSADVPSQLGPYVVQSRLGIGTMASVYRATHSVTHQVVALKLLRLPNERSESRLVKEATYMQQLSSPNILRLFEVGRTDDYLWYTMELQDRVLTDYLHPSPFTKENSGRLLSLDEKLRILSEVCAGLEYLHNKGYIHRDICPNNVILNTDLHPYICDLGMARHHDDIELPDSSRGNPKLYGAPEQDAALSSAGFEADIYSFGATAYHLVTGRLVKGAPPPRIRELIRELPEELGLAIDSCLSVSPKARPSSGTLRQVFLKYTDSPERRLSLPNSSDVIVIPSNFRDVLGNGYVNFSPHDVDEVAFSMRHCKDRYIFSGVACMALHIPEFRRFLTSLKQVRFLTVDISDVECVACSARILNKATEEVLGDLNSCYSLLAEVKATSSNIEVRRCRYPPPWRVVALDSEYVLVRNYKGRRFSFESPMMILDEGAFRDGFIRYTEMAWTMATPDRIG